MVPKTELFLSCDWGTSSFRLRLVETPSLQTIAVATSNEGIANTFALWERAGGDQEKRLTFYLDIIQRHIATLARKAKVSLTGVPLVISGMASSALGMIDLSYAALPCAVDGSNLVVKANESTAHFPHRVVMISGLRTPQDVMRGEETQLIGCVASVGTRDREQLFVFPGTHSKHVVVRKNEIVGFKTYLTGELFHLLSEKSILSASVENGEHLPEQIKLESFEKGVVASQTLNVLHHVFLVRTNALFDRCTKPENYYYLSGLLIGNELKELAHEKPAALTLVSNPALAPYYTAALRVLDIRLSNVMDVDEALVGGQFKIYSKTRAVK